MVSCRNVALLVAGLVLAACGGSQDLGAKDQEFAPKAFSSAAEFQAVEVAGADVCLTGSVAMEFTAPDQMFGYLLALAAGDTVRLQTAGDPGLDTVLALYGPADNTGFFGAMAVAADDDSGADGKAMVASYKAKTTGQYIAIVSTYGGAGLGKASLAITLNGAAGCDGSGKVACNANGDCDAGYVCDAATGTCVAQTGTCADGSQPQAEVCGDGIDNDCDGLVDEDCGEFCATDSDCATGQACVNGMCAGPACATDSDCATGQACVAGACVGGTCDADGSCPVGYACDAATGTCVPSAGPCADGSLPQAEVCGDGLDNDCDGLVDEGCGPACAADSDCASGTACVNGVCAGAACTADGDCPEGYACDASTGMCAAIPVCPDGSLPQAEVCGDGIDNDCDGLVDEDCGAACATDADCASGQACVNGLCAGGATACAADSDCPQGYACDAATGTCAVQVGACADGSQPQAEVCGDGIDNDCDGLVDEGCGDECASDSDCAAGQVCLQPGDNCCSGAYCDGLPLCGTCQAQ